MNIWIHEENKNKNIDAFLKKHVQEIPLETPSKDFIVLFKLPMASFKLFLVSLFKTELACAIVYFVSSIAERYSTLSSTIPF